MVSMFSMAGVFRSRFKQLMLIVGLLGLPLLASAKTVLVLGDSLSAGYGLKDGQSWVTLLADKLGDKHKVVNASVSGDTTANGLTRLPSALAQHKPDIVIIELGGNDGLRGQPLGLIEKNLSALISRSQKAGATVVLAGMQILPNYGPRYTGGFSALYGKLARQHQTALVPFLLEGIGGQATLMQADGIHPTAEAQPTIVANVLPVLAPLLAR